MSAMAEVSIAGGTALVWCTVKVFCQYSGTGARYRIVTRAHLILDGEAEAGAKYFQELQQNFVTGALGNDELRHLGGSDGIPCGAWLTRHDC